jgi:diaminohydroxyphosphoribosylaminopyrimidine deaminase / 5-amino-6-(5-phosphoribosylamino)uracil reductase
VREVRAFRQPVRIVIDANGRVRPSAAVFDSRGGGSVVMATTDSANQNVQTSWKQAGAEVLVLPSSEEGVDLHHLLVELGRRGVLQVYCEGGARLATSLLKLELVDRLDLHYGLKLVGGPGVSLGDIGVTTMAEAQEWSKMWLENRGDDVLMALERP